MIGKNGSATYSNIVFFGAQTKQATTLTLLQNPVYNAVSLNYTATENTPAEIAVYTVTGVKLLSQKQSLQKGANSINIALSNMLQKGIYLLEVKEGAASQAVKFVKQ